MPNCWFASQEEIALIFVPMRQHISSIIKRYFAQFLPVLAPDDQFLLPSKRALRYHNRHHKNKRLIPVFLSLLVVLASVGAALFIRLNLSIGSHDAPFLLFFAPVIISAWYGGLVMGVLSTVLSALAIDYFFVSPIYSFQLAIYILEGTVISFLFELMGNTKLKAELRAQALKQSEERFRLLVNNVEDYAIYILDPEGKIISWNEGAQRINYYKADEIIGKHFSAMYQAREITRLRPWRELAIAARNGRFEDEGWRTRKDSSRFWASNVITALLDPGGKLRGFSVITRDMTKHKQAQKALKELDKRKDQFISIASHELKTPVTTIKAFAQILKKQFMTLKDEKPVLYLSKMEDQLNKLTELVNDLLDVSRIGAEKLLLNKSLCDIDSLVKETAKDLLKTTDKHCIDIHTHANKKIMADEYRISQVVINLISNAIKYSGQRSNVIVKTTAKDSCVVISVQDFGIGISKENQRRIFDRFYQAGNAIAHSSPGLGLGLYIASEIVKRHNGRIWVESEEGKGATFFVSLPLTA